MGKVSKLHFLAFKYDPSQNGLACTLGELESIIMKDLWDRTRPASIKQIHYAVVASGHRVELTTIGTTVKRLFDKGLLVKPQNRDSGHFQQFEPSMTRLEYNLEVYRRVMVSLIVSSDNVDGLMKMVLEDMKDTINEL